MKKSIIAIMALLVIPFWLFSKEAFFIYRNDKQFNVFFFENVDSIKYSYYDEDNTISTDFACQEIFTPDSIYRIPLSAIDSIGFITPETVFKKDVKTLDGVMRYIENHSGLSFTIANDCPSSLIPKIGEKVATVDYNNLFPTGFAAQVAHISKLADQSTLIECEPIDLSEIFSCFYGLSSDLPVIDIPTETKSVTPRAVDGIFDRAFDLGEHDLINTNNFPGLTYEDNLSVQYPQDFRISIHPVLKAQGYVVVTQELGTQIGGTIVGEFSLKERFGFSGSISWTESIGHAFEMPVMYALPLVDLSLYLKPGTFIRTNALGSLQIEAQQQYISAFNFQFNSRHESSPLKTVCPNVRQTENSWVGSVFLEGNVDIGAYLDFGVTVVHPNFTNVALHNELGLRFSGNRTLFRTDFSSANTSTNLYQQLLDTKYNLGWFSETFISAALWPYEVSFPLPLKTYHPFAEISHVPIFANGTCIYSDGILTASMDINGDVFNPVDIGFVFFDENNNELGRVWTDFRYDNTIHKVSYRTSINAGSKVKYVVPLVGALGTEMLALPSFEVKKETYPLLGKWEPISSSDGPIDSSYYILTFYKDGSYLGSDFYDGTIREEGSYTYDGSMLSLFCDGNGDPNYRVSFPADDRMSLVYIPSEGEDDIVSTTIYKKVTEESIVGIWDPFAGEGELQSYYRMIMYPDQTYQGINISTGRLEKWGTYSYVNGYLTLHYTSDGVNWTTDDIQVHLSPDGHSLYGHVGIDGWAIYKYVGVPPEK